MNAATPPRDVGATTAHVLRHVHHVTSVVPSLEDALAPFARLIPPDGWLRESLPGRGVETARARLGGTWFVFVMPTGPGVPAERLAARGPGPLLVSFAVASLADAVAQLAKHGVRTASGARVGVGGWLVQDLELTLPGDVLVQLCEDPDVGTG